MEKSDIHSEHPVLSSCSPRKRLKAVEALLALSQSSPHADPQSAMLKEKMEKLRAKFRQVIDLLCFGVL